MILIFVALALGSVPWLLALSKRFGLLIAVPGTAAGAILLALAMLVVGRAASLDIVVTQVVGAALFAVAGMLLLRRTPGAVRRPGRYALALWISPLLGALGWIGTLVAAQFLPGAARLSWAMNGDGFNNIFYGDVIVSANGLALGQSENPVPLPASLLALAIAPGRSAVAAQNLLGHDLAAFTVVWTLILARSDRCGPSRSPARSVRCCRSPGMSRGSRCNGVTSTPTWCCRSFWPSGSHSSRRSGFPSRPSWSSPASRPWCSPPGLPLCWCPRPSES